MTYEITIEGTPHTWNAFIGNRTNWRYFQYKKVTQTMVVATLAPLRDKKWPLPRVRVTFCCGYPTKRRSDIDSLALKPHVDALVLAGVITDDNKDVVREVRVTWEKSKEPYTKILITTL